MSRSLNKLTLIGNVGNDPEIRATSSGARIAKLSLATSHTWKDKAGNENQDTQWHRLTFFGGLVDVVEKYVSRGDRLYVEGRVEYSQTEADGVKRYWTDVICQELIMLGGSGTSGEQPVASGGEEYGDSDLPF